MPRVKLGTPTPAQQRAVMNKIIKKAMVDCDIEDYTALGLRMGMSDRPSATDERRRVERRGAMEAGAGSEAVGGAAGGDAGRITTAGCLSSPYHKKEEFTMPQDYPSALRSARQTTRLTQEQAAELADVSLESYKLRVRRPDAAQRDCGTTMRGPGGAMVGAGVSQGDATLGVLPESIRYSLCRRR